MNFMVVSDIDSPGVVSGAVTGPLEDLVRYCVEAIRSHKPDIADDESLGEEGERVFHLFLQIGEVEVGRVNHWVQVDSADRITELREWVTNALE